MEKQIGLSFKDISLNAKGYEMDELIELIRVITNDKIVKEKKVEVKKQPEVEEIDIKKLRDNIRYPKTTSNFRCPNCGQGVLIKNNSTNMLLVRDVTSKKPTVYDVDVLELPTLYEYGEILKDVLIAVYNDLLTMKNEEKLLVDSEDVMCTCPVCEDENNMQTWIEAYENPMKYFEHMDMCDVCSEEGEIILTQFGDTFLCENRCIDKIKA